MVKSLSLLFSGHSKAIPMLDLHITGFKNVFPGEKLAKNKNKQTKPNRKKT